MINTPNPLNCLSPSDMYAARGTLHFSEKKEIINDIPAPFKTDTFFFNQSHFQFQSSPSKITNQKFNFIKSCQSINSPNRLFDQAIKFQNTLSPTSAQHIKAADNHPDLFILPDSIHITIENAGKGTQSTVYRTNRISNRGSPNSLRIVKVSRESYKPETSLFQQQLSPKSRKDSRIDLIQETYAMANKQYLAVFKNSDVDLYLVDYNKMAFPIKFIVEQLKDMAGGLYTMHRGNIVHRDIKGPNLLVNYQGKGKVTDTGLSKKDSPGVTSSTVCTPFYAAPFIWKNLEAQTNRKGYQGIKSDVFSFGRTIQYDVIVRILDHLSQKHSVDVSPLGNAIKPKIYEEKAIAQLRLQNSYPEEMEQKFPGQILLNNTIMYIFPKREDSYKDTRKAIELFKEFLKPLEFDRLNGLATLAFELQDCNSENLPNMDIVEERLEKNLQSADEAMEVIELETSIHEVEIDDFNDGKGPIFFTQMATLPSPINTPTNASKRKRTDILELSPDSQEQVVKKAKHIIPKTEYTRSSPINTRARTKLNLYHRMEFTPDLQELMLKNIKNGAPTKVERKLSFS